MAGETRETRDSLKRFLLKLSGPLSQAVMRINEKMLMKVLGELAF